MTLFDGCTHRTLLPIRANGPSLLSRNADPQKKNSFKHTSKKSAVPISPAWSSNMGVWKPDRPSKCNCPWPAQLYQQFPTLLDQKSYRGKAEAQIRFKLIQAQLRFPWAQWSGFTLPTGQWGLRRESPGPDFQADVPFAKGILCVQGSGTEAHRSGFTLHWHTLYIALSMYRHPLPLRWSLGCSALWPPKRQGIFFLKNSQAEVRSIYQWIFRMVIFPVV